MVHHGLKIQLAFDALYKTVILRPTLLTYLLSGLGLEGQLTWPWP